MLKKLLVIALCGAACVSSEPKETRPVSRAALEASSTPVDLPKSPEAKAPEAAPAAVKDETKKDDAAVVADSRVRRKEVAPSSHAARASFAAAPKASSSGDGVGGVSDRAAAIGASSVASEGRGLSSRPPESAGVQAGSSDDNLSFNAFLQFLEKNGRRALPYDASRRIVVEVQDAQGLPIFGAKVTAADGEGHALVRHLTYPDGRTLLFPSSSQGSLRVEYGGVSQELPLDGPRIRTVKLDVRRKEIRKRVPLDVAFIIDTTGSMGDEISRLKKTLDVIHFQLTHLDPAADVRFGLVEYKDHGDNFVTRPIPFTSDIEAFRAALANLKAYGGGDYPEDVQAGLEQGLHALQWRDGNTVKVAFLIGDAPPHLDYGEQFTYQSAMHEAARRGIKIAAVGCSGLDTKGEVVWREIAQHTMAPYVFLTRGERGDMEGSASTVSHHVGSNWIAENLETIVVRVVKSELEPLSPKLVARQEDFFDAAKGAKLGELFKQTVKQLVDYSVAPIDAKAPMRVGKLSVKSPDLTAAALKLERELRAAVNEQESAPLALESQLAQDKAGRPELFVKLMRVSTGEMLSLSLVKLDPSLVR